MKYRIKIVPKATPNADGEWRDWEGDLSDVWGWIATANALRDHVPETHFLAAVEGDRSAYPDKVFIKHLLNSTYGKDALLPGAANPDEHQALYRQYLEMLRKEQGSTT